MRARVNLPGMGQSVPGKIRYCFEPIQCYKWTSRCSVTQIWSVLRASHTALLLPRPHTAAISHSYMQPELYFPPFFPSPFVGTFYPSQARTPKTLVICRLQEFTELVFRQKSDDAPRQRSPAHWTSQSTGASRSSQLTHCKACWGGRSLPPPGVRSTALQLSCHPVPNW